MIHGEGVDQFGTTMYQIISEIALFGQDQSLYKITPIWYILKAGGNTLTLYGLDTGQWVCEDARGAMVAENKDTLFAILDISEENNNV